MKNPKEAVKIISINEIKIMFRTYYDRKRYVFDYHFLPDENFKHSYQIDFSRYYGKISQYGFFDINDRKTFSKDALYKIHEQFLNLHEEKVKSLEFKENFLIKNGDKNENWD